MGFPLPEQGVLNGNEGGETGGAPQSGGVHPAWNDVLGVIPQELHTQVIPHFQKWDSNTQKVHQRSAPYKEFIDNNVSPDDIRQAMAVARALNDNPERVYGLLHEQFGNATPNQGGQGLPGQSQEEADPYEGFDLPPAVREKLERIDQLQNGFDTMAEIMLSQRQRNQQEEEDAELDALYQDLEQKDPIFAALNKDGAAEPYINSMLHAGYQPEQALEAFKAFVDSVGQYQNRPKPPVPLGAGGSLIPQNGVDPRRMDPRQTKDFVAETLKAALHGNR
jgi:hypothetical protein